MLEVSPGGNYRNIPSMSVFKGRLAVLDIFQYCSFRTAEGLSFSQTQKVHRGFSLPDPAIFSQIWYNQSINKSIQLYRTWSVSKGSCSECLRHYFPRGPWLIFETLFLMGTSWFHWWQGVEREPLAVLWRVPYWKALVSLQLCSRELVSASKLQAICFLSKCQNHNLWHWDLKRKNEKAVFSPL